MSEKNNKLRLILIEK